MKTPRFDMADRCREALRIFADSDKPALQATVQERWASLKKEAQEAMDGCDRRNEQERADFEGLLLFLCAVEDFQKHVTTKSALDRERLFNHAVRKLDSARYNYERA